MKKSIPPAQPRIVIEGALVRENSSRATHQPVTDAGKVDGGVAGERTAAKNVAAGPVDDARRGHGFSRTDTDSAAAQIECARAIDTISEALGAARDVESGEIDVAVDGSTATQIDDPRAGHGGIDQPTVGVDVGCDSGVPATGRVRI